MPGHTVARRILADLVAFMSAQGAVAAAWLAVRGLDSLTANTDGLDNLPPLAQLFDDASVILNDERLGVRVAALETQGARGLANELATNADCLLAALQVRAKYCKLSTTAFDLRVLEGRHTSRLVVSFADTPTSAQFVDYVVAWMLLWIRRILSDSKWEPTGVQVEYAGSRKSSHFDEITSIVPTKSSKVTCLVFDNASLRRSIPGANALTFQTLLKQAEAALYALRSARRLRWSTESMIRDMLPHGRVTLNEVAVLLQVSSRTLQRSLANEGTTFGYLLDAARHEKAYELVAGTSLSLTQIALQLGFSELSSFSRAMKTWFGASPLTIRRRLRLLERSMVAKTSVQTKGLPASAKQSAAIGLGPHKRRRRQAL